MGIAELFQKCDPTEPLEPGDARYVNLDSVRGGGFLNSYARAFWRATPNRPVVRLFSGHFGAGKSSELKRLQSWLERPTERGNPDGKPFLVVYTDLRMLDQNDLDWPDMLVAIAGVSFEALQSANIPGFSPATSLMRDRWDELKGALLSEVKFGDASVDTGFATLAVELGNRPSSRSILRKAVEQRATGLQHAVKDMMREANEALRKQGKAGLVIVIDGLERMPRRMLEEGCDTHERLFLRRCNEWCDLGAHTIMTVPVSVLYSPAFDTLNQRVGGATRGVPMVKLRDIGEPERDDHPGIDAMLDILRARCLAAGMTLEKAFDRDAALHLARMSGGHPRNLLISVCEAINLIDELPVKLAVAQKATTNMANSLARSVPEEKWAALESFLEPSRERPTDDVHRDMLLYLYLFEYMNGEPWFAINPLLKANSRYRR